MLISETIQAPFFTERLPHRTNKHTTSLSKNTERNHKIYCILSLFQISLGRFGVLAFDDIGVFGWLYALCSHTSISSGNRWGEKRLIVNNVCFEVLCNDVAQVTINEAKTANGACYLELKVPSRSRRDDADNSAKKNPSTPNVSDAISDQFTIKIAVIAFGLFPWQRSDKIDDETAMSLWHLNLKLLLVTFGDKGCNYYTRMNVDKLMKMAGAVRTGGKGSMRRKKKDVHKTTITDDKKLQGTLRRLGVSGMPSIEEVNIYKDDSVIQFVNPKGVVSEKLQDILPGIFDQLGPDAIRKLAEQLQKQMPGAGEAASAATATVEDDDEVPELMPGETFEAAAA
ncbi:nascent polypeptide-associated complex subunit beta-like protein [Tanacetum coccineum]|uniref:Nascent polypeptide-associated complex subunit beta n=1 Tax=Tanacetum coccineum TaxID=301880 RepID=A0ABQ5HVA7_9ASTR